MRHKRGMTQEQLSGISQVGTPYISGLENGHHDPTLGVLLKLSQALDTTLEELLRNVE